MSGEEKTMENRGLWKRQFSLSAILQDSQKDVDARWTKKRGQSHFGYKNHVAVDVKHKFIRKWQVSAANVHDSQVFLEIRTCSRSLFLFIVWLHLMLP